MASVKGFAMLVLWQMEWRRKEAGGWELLESGRTRWLAGITGIVEGTEFKIEA